MADDSLQMLNENCTTLSQKNHTPCIMIHRQTALYRREEKVIEMVQYNYIRFLYFTNMRVNE